MEEQNQNNIQIQTTGESGGTAKKPATNPVKVLWGVLIILVLLVIAAAIRFRVGNTPGSVSEEQPQTEEPQIPTKESQIPIEEQIAGDTTSAIERQLDEIDIGNLDSEFEAIDADVNQL